MYSKFTWACLECELKSLSLKVWTNLQLFWQIWNSGNTKPEKELLKTGEWNVIIGVKLMGTVNAILCATND